MADYPGAIVSLSNPAPGNLTPNPSHIDQHADANDEIEAIETELGTHPSGAAATVAARFTADEAALQAHIDDTADAHNASAISILDAVGDFTATDVEGALAELQSDAEAHLGDVNDAHNASAISIVDAGGDFTATDVEGALNELQADNEAHAALSRHASISGTSFPTQPAYGNGVPFYRSDRNIWYFYDGTRWLSDTLYSFGLDTQSALVPLAATVADIFRATAPWAGTYDLWLESFQTSFRVIAGTALSASHKWVISVATAPAGSTVATYTIDSGALDAWRNSGAVAIAALLGTTRFMFEAGAAKTGTPGNLIFMPRIQFRLVG